MLLGLSLLLCAMASQVELFKTFETHRQREGAGFQVRRALGSVGQLDPFLMLDHMGPTDYAPRTAGGHFYFRNGRFICTSKFSL